MEHTHMELEKKWFDKTELVARLHTIHGNVTPEQLEQIINDTFTQIALVLAEYEREIVLDNIGSFSMDVHGGKVYKNPNTGEVEDFSEYLKLKFRAAKAFKQTVHENVRPALKDMRIK